MNKVFLAIPFFALTLCVGVAHAADEPAQPALGAEAQAPVDPNQDARLKAQQAYIKTQEEVARKATTPPPSMMKMIDAQQSLLDRAQQDAKKQEDLMDTAIENQKRWGKILDKWEAQQAQYQKYLDSLPTSKNKDAQ